MRRTATISLASLMLLASACSDAGSAGEASESTTTVVEDDTVTESSTAVEEESGAADDATATTDTAALDGIGDVVQIATGFSFTEGPAWDAENERLVFSDVSESQILSVTLDGEVTVLAERPANGIVTDSRGGFIVAGMSGQDLISMSADGTVEAFDDTYDGSSFNQPNDLVELVGAGFFFTDPVFGNDGGSDLCLGVYFVSYDGEVTQLLCDDDDLPNGIALSPDDSTLYIAHTESGDVTQSSVAADGSVGEEALFVETAGRADGMVVADDGTLHVATSAGIEMFSADGESLGTIEFPEQPSNATIGGVDGSTLFVTARSSVYAVEIG